MSSDKAKEINTTDSEKTLLKSDLPDWRTARLTALYYLVELADRNAIRLIKSITDHEGTIIVNWIIEPNAEEKKLLSTTWGSLGEDGNCCSMFTKGN